MNGQLRKYKRRKQSTGLKDIRFFVEVFPFDPKASLSRALKVAPLKDVRAQNFPHTDFVKTLTAGRE